MKKTHQALISIFSLIIILSFSENVFAQNVCVLKWWTDSAFIEVCTMYGCYIAPGNSGQFEPAGTASTEEISMTQQATLEVFQQVFGTPDEFVSDCYESRYDSSGDFTSKTVCMDGTWTYYVVSSSGSAGTTESSVGGWDVVCGPDADGDGIPDSEDNNTIYGYLKDVDEVAIEGATVNIVEVTCGAELVVATEISNAAGYYSFGNLESGKQYMFSVSKPNFSFVPVCKFVNIPQTEIQSYDFTATAD